MANRHFLNEYLNSKHYDQIKQGDQLRDNHVAEARQCLKKDRDAFMLNGLMTFAGAINAIKKNNYSWAFIQCYYTIFYLAEALLAINDIFDLPLTYVPNDATKQEVSQLLKTIQAPLGKFAVLGEQDNVDKNVKSMVTDILKTSDFELLNNRSIRLRNGSQASITLIGLDSLVGGTIDINKAFSNVNQEEFNILMTHCPDTIQLEDLPKTNIDLMFAGHSHGSQIYIPLLGALSSDEGAQEYNHGKHTVNQTVLHVSNGMGTTAMDMRLFSPPQMLVYRLRSDGKEEKTESKDTQDKNKQEADTKKNDQKKKRESKHQILKKSKTPSEPSTKSILNKTGKTG